MKLNFWQTIGLIVVVVAAALIVIREMSETKSTPPIVPATQTAQ